MTAPEWPEPTHPGFVVFHQDYRPDGYGEGRPEDLSYFAKPKIEEYLRGVLVHPGNFVGLIDQFDKTLQFYVNEDGSIQIDYVVEERGGSLCKAGDIEEGVRLLHEAGPSLADLHIPDAVFEPWR